MPYARIAEVLREKRQLSVRRETIFKFVKVRSRGRKGYVFKGDSSMKRPKPPLLKSSPGHAGTRPEPEPDFKFAYSERYNLTRLPPAEAARRRKKLEEQGH